jgi:hypothetical protein
VQLGATSAKGLPADLFVSGQGHWLAVQIGSEAEQPRALLVAVPYAMKAVDAETVGGLPASAFVLAAPPTAGNPSNAGNSAAATSGLSQASSSVTTTGGVVNTLPLWTTGTNIQSSVITQTGSGSSAKIGINTTTPAATLDVKGGETLRGLLYMPPTAAATATAGKNSEPIDLVASSFSSTLTAPVNQTFQFVAEPAGNNTANPSGTLNLLYALGAAAPAETGLKISNKGVFTFAAGQTFPGTGPGTVKSVGFSAPSSDFTVSGSPVTSTGTLGLNWTVAPTSANTASTIVKRAADGSFSAGRITGTDFSEGSSGVSGTGTTGVAGAGSKTGVYGYGPTGVTGAGINMGVYGISSSTGNSIGVFGFGPTGVSGISSDSAGTGVAGSSSGGQGLSGYDSAAGDGILVGVADTVDGWAGWFNGNLEVDGNLSKAGGSFKIDHPLDPANKYLYHSFVESPDMKNIYDGNVTTDAQGDALVGLPEWFETLNRDFRYQLTVIGQFAQAIVAGEIAHGQFSIKTDKPNVKVSWQVTGIRQDAWANAHRIPVEETKPERERGFYLHPELYDAAEEKGVLWATHPQAVKQWKEARIKAEKNEKQAPAKP